jgi:phosphotransacetylase
MFNMVPTFEEKATVLKGLFVDVPRTLGANPVRAAALLVVEKRNPAIESGVDAAEIAEMIRGMVTVCDGPLALDAILMPSIDVGIVIIKAPSSWGLLVRERANWC